MPFIFSHLAGGIHQLVRDLRGCLQDLIAVVTRDSIGQTEVVFETPSAPCKRRLWRASSAVSYIPLAVDFRVAVETKFSGSAAFPAPCGTCLYHPPRSPACCRIELDHNIYVAVVDSVTNLSEMSCPCTGAIVRNAEKLLIWDSSANRGYDFAALCTYIQRRLLEESKAFVGIYTSESSRNTGAVAAGLPCSQVSGSSVVALAADCPENFLSTDLFGHSQSSTLPFETLHPWPVSYLSDKNNLRLFLSPAKDQGPRWARSVTESLLLSSSSDSLPDPEVYPVTVRLSDISPGPPEYDKLPDDNEDVHESDGAQTDSDSDPDGSDEHLTTPNPSSQQPPPDRTLLLVSSPAAPSAEAPLPASVRQGSQVSRLSSSMAQSSLSSCHDGTSASVLPSPLRPAQSAALLRFPKSFLSAAHSTSRTADHSRIACLSSSESLSELSGSEDEEDGEYDAPLSDENDSDVYIPRDHASAPPRKRRRLSAASSKGSRAGCPLRKPEGMFVCDISGCRKTFTREHDLRRHVDGPHNGDIKRACSGCGKKYSRLDSLKRHLRSAEGCKALSTEENRVLLVRLETEEKAAKKAEKVGKSQKGQDDGQPASTKRYKKRKRVE